MRRARSHFGDVDAVLLDELPVDGLRILGQRDSPVDVEAIPILDRSPVPPTSTTRGGPRAPLEGEQVAPGRLVMGLLRWFSGRCGGQSASKSDNPQPRRVRKRLLMSSNAEPVPGRQCGESHEETLAFARQARYLYRDEGFMMASLADRCCEGEQR